jgi:hypothetical protein
MSYLAGRGEAGVDTRAVSSVWLFLSGPVRASCQDGDTRVV